VNRSFFSPHGHLIASASDDQTIRFWLPRDALFLADQNHADLERLLHPSLYFFNQRLEGGRVVPQARFILRAGNGYRFPELSPNTDLERPRKRGEDLLPWLARKRSPRIDKPRLSRDR